jgi:hypothetical protein
VRPCLKRSLGQLRLRKQRDVCTFPIPTYLVLKQLTHLNKFHNGTIHANAIFIFMSTQMDLFSITAGTLLFQLSDSNIQLNSRQLKQRHFGCFSQAFNCPSKSDLGSVILMYKILWCSTIFMLRGCRLSASSASSQERHECRQVGLVTGACPSSPPIWHRGFTAPQPFEAQPQPQP